ncbi:MAG: helix-turn-helix transcriptional regulator [Clostridiales bacterium]|nr:helix-turn-helix transcriptional regulator [Clostridiales bacterium]
MQNFSKILKELRNERKLSLKQLVKEIGVSDIAISRWENNLRIPNIEALIKLAQFFGVSTDFLLGLKDY